jgi:TonB family protein
MVVTRFGFLAGIVVVAAVGSCAKPAPALVSPRELENSPPDPALLEQTQAAQQGRDGAVRVKFCIDPQGVPRDVNVVESFEPETDAIAIRTVEQWRYAPATRDGEPYTFCTDVLFQIDNG